ncbi:MAG: tripartite tricarboxylate transporter substrate binding protein, partial [Burkholderiaceae bacterium]|nr:tripartite tricarboxylate transporter substrate binding protein [Burkholderiaceae bacterium]
MRSMFHPGRRRALTAITGAITGAVTGATLLAAAPAAVAQAAWPAKPVRILIGAPPGGSTDIVARLLAEGLQKELGQTMGVEA